MIFYQAVVWISKAWNSVKSATISNCFTKSFENAYFKEVNAECDEFPCFGIDAKFDHLLFDPVEKYKNESSINEKTNDNSVEEVEEDAVITWFRAYEYARKL